MTNELNRAFVSHVLGVRSAVDLVTPTGVDSDLIFKFMVLRGKKSAEQVVAEAAAAVGAANQYLANTYGGLFTVTDSMYSFTRQGETARSMTPKSAEFANPDPVRSDNIGHMLPLTDYKDALGWTPEYLRDAFEMQLVSDVQFITERWINRIDFQVIKRMLTTTENAVGAAGYDVPWAIGTGVNVNYIPPQYGAKVFDANHTHFIWKDAATDDRIDLLNAMQNELRHHGHRGNLVALIPDSEVETYKALTGFVKIRPPQVQYGGGSTITYADGSTYEGIPGQLVGYFEGDRGLIELFAHVRVPAKYAYMTRPYGLNATQNGLAIRRHPDIEFGLKPDVRVTSSLTPRLERVNFDATFGVGVNDRLNGVAGFIDTGASAYTSPSDSTLGGGEI